MNKQLLLQGENKSPKRKILGAVIQFFIFFLHLCFLIFDFHFL